jgi:hypothetical protein
MQQLMAPAGPSCSSFAVACHGQHLHFTRPGHRGLFEKPGEGATPGCPQDLDLVHTVLRALYLGHGRGDVAVVLEKVAMAQQISVKLWTGQGPSLCGHTHQALRSPSTCRRSCWVMTRMLAQTPDWSVLP